MAELGMFLTSVILCVLCASVMGYYLWKYYLCRASMAIHIRHPGLPLISLSILLAFVLVQRPLASTIWTLGKWKSNPIAPMAIADLLFGICYFGNLFAILWRVYWLNFDMHTYREGMGVSWMHFIDPRSEDTALSREQDLKTKGNFRWCLTRYCAAVSICAIMFTVLGLPILRSNNKETKDKTRGYITEMSFLLLVSTMVAVYTVVLWNDLPHDDLKYLYFVKAELRYILWTMLGGWLLCIIGIPIGESPKKSHWILYFDIVPTIVALPLALVQSLFVLEINHIDMKKVRNKRLQKSAKVDVQFKRDKEKFVVAMQSDTVFNLFVSHLQKEYSLENLLCAMELRQLATLVLSAPVWQMDDSREGNISRSKFLARHDHDFYQRAPDSAIVTSNFPFEAKVSQLYQKYISTAAQMQVNLPSQLRQRWELFHLSFCSEVGVDATTDVATAVDELANHLQNDLGEVVSPGGPDDYLAGDEPGVTPRGPAELPGGPMDPREFLAWQYDGDGGLVNDPGFRQEFEFQGDQSLVVRGGGVSAENERQYYLQVLTLIDMTIREAYKLMCDSYTRFNENAMTSSILTDQLKQAKLNG